jgi:uncharacterized membrane protein
MKNRNVGFLITGIGLVIVVIIFLFNKGLKDIVSETCTHGPSCAMYGTITIQTWMSVALAALVIVIGLFFIFSKEKERIVIKKIKEKTRKLDLNGLDKDEKKVIELLQRENGAVFQSSLMEEMSMGKVKATRLLDKLEAKQFIERKRRGMNNIVVLKQ